jgi:hypothetical protein
MTDHDEARDEPTAAPQAGSAPAGRSESLAAAEELAAREAAEEAGRNPKVVRPTAKTSRRAAGKDAASEGTDKAAATLASAEAKAPTEATGPTPAVGPSGPVEVITAGAPDEIVRLHRAGTDAVSATNVDVSMGAIGRADATDVAVSQGAIGLARGERISVEMGAIGAAIGGEVRLTQGAAGTVLAREARVEQAFVRALVANNVVVERTTGVLFLVARRVEGDVRAVLDWRGALAFGAAFALVAGLLRRRR